MNQFDFLKDDEPDDGTIRIRTTTPARPVVAKKKPARLSDANANALGCLLFLACLGGCVSCVMNLAKQTPEEFAASDQSVAALMEAQRHIRPMLKSPASAKWPSMWGDDRPLGGVQKMPDGTYLVTSCVDSQNGFGAMVRTWFRVHLRVRQKGRAEILGAQVLGARP